MHKLQTVLQASSVQDFTASVIPYEVPVPAARFSKGTNRNRS